MSVSVGQPVNRRDGHLKVTGGARYAADVALPGLVHAVLVDSAVARGRIRALDTAAAERAPGVLTVITHLNAPKLYYPPDAPRDGASTLRRVAVRAFAGPDIYFAGQHVAVVVADTLERATYAAGLVAVSYDREPPVTVLAANLDRAFRPERINGNRETDTASGDVEGGLRDADARLDATYLTPIEHHNAMELSACTAVWEGTGEGRHLTVYDSTQGVYDQRATLATTFSLSEERVRVVCPFLGGGFGSKMSVRPHTAIAAAAAERVGRPVKLVLTREQMFTSIGYRPANVQRLRLGARRDGRLTAVAHDAVLGTATHEEWVEQSAAISRMLYACSNRRTTHRAVRLNLDTPTIMRAPGEAPGSFASEQAIDEIAHQLGIDPIDLRLRNYADADPESGLPWSSNSLRQCLEAGAQHFGWSQRNAQPRTTRVGHELVGFGVAAAARAVNLLPATVHVRLFANGRVEIATAAHDIGTGTYTILAQITGDVLGLAPDQIDVALGDTVLPRSPAAGGSTTAPSVGSATQLAASEARRALTVMAIEDRRSPLFGINSDDIDLTEGRLIARAIPQARGTHRRFAVAERLRAGAPVRGRGPLPAADAKGELDVQFRCSVLRGAGGRRPRHRAGRAAARCVRSRPRAQRENRAQPADRRHDPGPRHGATGGNLGRSPLRALRQCQHGGLSRPGECRRSPRGSDLGRRGRSARQHDRRQGAGGDPDHRHRRGGRQCRLQCDGCARARVADHQREADRRPAGLDPA
jgi:xanthine dehydrogenase YagR molybdenum-binding subunit